MGAFSGSLNQNAVFTVLYNMIISQQVFSNNIVLKGTLADKFRTDGTLYGDTKLYLSTDVGLVRDFPDTGRTLLSKQKPTDPKTQSITMKVFKQTALTIDGVKLKQAFSSQDIYDAFISVCMQWLEDAYKILNVTMINTFIGVHDNPSAKNVQSVSMPAVPATIVEKNAWYNLLGESVGEKIANICIDLQDALRDYNSYGFLRSYSLNDFFIVWNSSYKNKIKHISLPSIFHNDQVLGDKFEEFIINSRFFGTPVSAGGTSNGTQHTLVDRIITVESKEVQLFAGDVIPTGQTFGATDAYTVDDTIICKLVHKDVLPFMSGLKMESEFYNPKDLDRNHYLTWGFNELEYLKEYPVVTIKLATGA